jgi:hypothetical protein
MLYVYVSSMEIDIFDAKREQETEIKWRLNGWRVQSTANRFFVTFGWLERISSTESQPKPNGRSANGLYILLQQMVTQRTVIPRVIAQRLIVFY